MAILQMICLILLSDYTNQSKNVLLSLKLNYIMLSFKSSQDADEICCIKHLGDFLDVPLCQVVSREP